MARQGCRGPFWPVPPVTHSPPSLPTPTHPPPYPPIGLYLPPPQNGLGGVNISQEGQGGGEWEGGRRCFGGTEAVESINRRIRWDPLSFCKILVATTFHGVADALCSPFTPVLRIAKRDCLIENALGASWAIFATFSYQWKMAPELLGPIPCHFFVES